MDISVYLPTYTTSFIGRDRTTAHICALLHNPEPGTFTTLVGTSGAGKTRLALQVAEVFMSHTDGVYFVPLASVRSPHFVLQTIAHTLGIREVGIESLFETIVRSLRERSVLLILDNFEQVVEAAQTVVQLVRRLPHIQLIITSQMILGVPEEQVFHVPPLPYPDAIHLSQAEAHAYAAVQLFEDRIRTVQPQFVLSDDQVPAVIEICQLLKGLPLSIELVAAHSDVLLPTDLVVLLRNHLKMYAIRPVTHTRDRLVWPVLNWCFSMLEAEDQLIFRRLSVFQGGSTLESIVEVCVDYQVHGHVQHILTQLRQKHFIEEEQLPGAETRFIMLDAVHAFVQAILPQPEAAELAAKHAQYYRALVQRRSAEQSEYTWTQLQSEVHNLRSALTWLLAHKQTEAALMMTSALQPMWYATGALSEGRSWLHQALDQSDTTEMTEVAQARHAAGVLAIHQGDHDAASRLFAQNLTFYTQTQDGLSLARTWNNLALTLQNIGQYVQARSYLNQLLEYSLLHEQRFFQGVAHSNLAQNYEACEDYVAAQHHAQLANAIFKELDRAYGLIQTEAQLGSIAAATDDLQTAEHFFSQSVQRSRELQHSLGVADALIGIAMLCFKRQTVRPGLQAIQESLTIQRDVDNVQGCIVALKVGTWLWSLVEPHTTVLFLSGLEQMRTKTSIVAWAHDRRIEAALLEQLHAAVAEPERTLLWEQGATLPWYELLDLLEAHVADYLSRHAAAE